nr:hypothetical protein B0A51_01317 [Rachicladosporium sp. CCFEE 5018]
MYRAAFRAHSRLAFGSVAGGAIAFGTIVARSQPLHADSGEKATAWTAQSTVTASKNRTPAQEGAHIDAFKQPDSERNRSKSRTPAPPPQTKDRVNYSASKQGSDATASSAWTTITAPLAAARDTFTNIDLDINLAKIGDTITDYVLPTWVKGLPALISKLQDEMSMAPWSLSWEIWEDAHDPEKNPEIVWDAEVRISSDLCLEEQQYLAKRKVAVAKALAEYLDVPANDVHPDDVPVIAIYGSGGGLRALIAGTSSYLSAQQAGLFDCTTYTAGVSGSCWLQTLYYSSIGQTDFGRLADHFKARLNVHLAFPPAALGLLGQAPTNKFLLGGVVEKLKGVPDAEFGVVDIYGMLLAARLLVPKGELGVSDWDLKVSNQRYFVDHGDKPLPIYTAVRHETEVEHDGREASASVERKRKEAAYFQWFEWTPYEFFCEELNAGIPTWATGRPFNAGETLWRDNGLALPEVRVPLMMGIWGSAFCATLSDYYKEIQPLLRGSGLGLGSSLDALLSDKDADMVKVHPLDPASIPNFALGLRGKLPATCPESIHNDSHLRLMDAGMSNNLPIYPLLRPGRNVDVIIAFDVSADAPHANWIGVAGGYAKQRKIKGWPLGAGWPPRAEPDAVVTKELADAEATAKETVTQAQAEDDLSHCTVWVGSTTESSVAPEDIPAAKHVSSDLEIPEISRPDAGIAVIYFPLITNDSVPGVDPQKSDYMSTWNFVYTPEEIDKVMALAKANFAEGEEQTKRTVRAVWQRKMEGRLGRENEARDLRARMRMRRGEPLGKTGWGDHFV